MCVVHCYMSQWVSRSFPDSYTINQNDNFRKVLDLKKLSLERQLITSLSHRQTWLFQFSLHSAVHVRTRLLDGSHSPSSRGLHDWHSPACRYWQSLFIRHELVVQPWLTGKWWSWIPESRWGWMEALYLDRNNLFPTHQSTEREEVFVASLVYLPRETCLVVFCMLFSHYSQSSWSLGFIPPTWPKLFRDVIFSVTKHKTCMFDFEVSK
jgi:hypothetical protein